MSGNTLAITMWEFSWLERRWPGAGYEDWDKALDGLKARGYDAVRIDAFPHLVAIDPYREWELLPHWNQQDWGSPAINRVKVQPMLNQFIRKCSDRGIKVALSAWFRTDRDNSALLIPSAQRHAEIWIKTLETIDSEGLLNNILYVDMCNEWPLEVWAPFYKPQNLARSWTSQQSVDWMKTAVEAVRKRFPSLKYCFSITNDFDKWRGVDVSYFDLLELHLWMAQCSDEEFFKRINYNYERFDSIGYENIAKYAERLYQSCPDYWLSKLKAGIENLADWASDVKLPIITTECWSLVDYKDWPLLNWGWIKEICEFGVNEALKTGKWSAMATSNFCGPQFHGMWDDIEWHKRMTNKIHQCVCKGV